MRVCLLCLPHARATPAPKPKGQDSHLKHATCPYHRTSRMPPAPTIAPPPAAATKAIWYFDGIYATSRHIPGVKFAGIIHPGLIGTAPSQELLDIWNARYASGGVGGGGPAPEQRHGRRLLGRERSEHRENPKP